NASRLSQGKPLHTFPDHALVAVRYAIEHGAARFVWRARIVERHHAAAASDEYALADDHRLLVADDHARMRGSKIGTRAVGPDDCIARKEAAPAVVAGNVRALAGTVLRQGWRDDADAGGKQNREHKRPCDHRNRPLTDLAFTDP